MSSGRPEPLHLPAAVRQHCYPSAAESAGALAAAIARRLQEGVERRGQASLVVSGGRSPVAFLTELASQPIDWSRVTVCLADERLVAADHVDRNEALVRQHLLQGPGADARLLPLAEEIIRPGLELAAAERALAAMPRPFDAVVLGMGEDGHTASLFPGATGTADALDAARPAQVALITPSAAPHRRVTLTLRALLDTRAVIILIRGEIKRATLEQAARGDPHRFPVAALLRQTVVPVEVYYSA